jgi:ribose transport system permease protein
MTDPTKEATMNAGLEVVNDDGVASMSGAVQSAGGHGPALAGGLRLQMRFLAIWLALAALLIVGGIIVPRSLLPSNMLAVIPLAAFLTVAAMGQALVLMTRGIDLSIPAIVTLSSTLLLGISGGSDSGLVPAIVVALLAATAIGLVNGALVGLLQLNALIVTLAVGAILSGITLWYRQGLPAESGVPPVLADWGGSRVLGVNVAVWVAALLVIVLTVILRKTTIGRHFSAVGANPRAAHVAGISLPAYQIAAFVTAGFLYGVVGILLSAFIRNPTLDVGNPYLLAPIAAAVLGGTAMSGGIGSMVAVAGAALFLTHLGQMLKMMGIATSFQLIVQGIAIALGMALAQVNLLPRLGRKPAR